MKEARIVTYADSEGYMFSQLQLPSNERILISLSRQEKNSLKIFRLVFKGYIPIKTVYKMNLTEIVDVFADPAHYGEPVLPNIIGPLLFCKSTRDIKEKLDELRNFH